MPIVARTSQSVSNRANFASLRNASCYRFCSAADRLSRKQAKDLLKFQTVAVRGKSRVRHDTMLAPGDMVEIGAARQDDIIAGAHGPAHRAYR